MRSCCLFIFLACSLCHPCRAQVTAELVISDTGHTIISRNIYGTFAEHLGRGIYDGFYRGGQIRMEVVNALKQIKLPNLRWPGGCFADQYHWRDGTGPLNLRPKTVNTTWGMVTEDNSFGTAEFLELCKLIGCEPYIAGNVGTGTLQEMKDWVEYLNFNGKSTLSELRAADGHPAPYKVSFWGVGNESWGCGGLMTPETYATQYRTYALFAKNYPGAPLKKIAGGANGEDYHWTEVLMKNIPLWEMWGLSFHYYTRDDETKTPHSATSFDEAEYFNYLKKALHIEDLINQHGAIMDKYDPKHQVAMVIDEWGIWVDAEPGTNPAFAYQQSSLRDALIAASTLNIFNNHADRIKMANLAQAVNVIQSLILTKGDQMVLTPTYHVFELYKVHQDARLLPIKLNSPFYAFGKDKLKAVNASASKDKDGIIHISLVNLDPNQTVTLKATLPGITGHTVTGQVLTSPKFTGINTFEQPDHIRTLPFNGVSVNGDGLTVELPGKSVVLLEIKP
jgi:alpha-N-arabinofuranosidase